MKTKLLLFLAAFGMLFASCKKDENSYRCFITLESESESEVSELAVDNEAETIAKAYIQALNVEDNGYFTLQAADEKALKSEIASRCAKAVSALSQQWEGYHTLVVAREIDDKHSESLYETTFGIKPAENSKNLSTPFDEYHLTRLTENRYYFFDNEDYFIYDFLLTIDGAFFFPQQKYKDMGWDMVFSHSFNYKCGQPSAPDIFFLLKVSKNPEKPVTDLICLNSDSTIDVTKPYTYNGRTYHHFKRYGNANGDLNQGVGGKYIYLLYTTDYNEGYKLCNLEFIVADDYKYHSNYPTEVKNSRKVELVKMIDAKTNGLMSAPADLNAGCGTDSWYIWLYARYVK